MKKTRDIMNRDPECIDETATLSDAARKMQQLDVGALPIRGQDNKLKGMLTDRDIVVKGLSEGRDPASTRVSELADGALVTVDADASIEDAMQKMTAAKVRRVLVVDDDDLVGIISQGDIAIHLDNPQVGRLVEAISAAP